MSVLNHTLLARNAEGRQATKSEEEGRKRTTLAGTQGFELRYRGPESGECVSVRSVPLWLAPVFTPSAAVFSHLLWCGLVQNVSFSLRHGATPRFQHHHVSSVCPGLLSFADRAGELDQGSGIAPSSRPTRRKSGQ